MGDVDVPVTPRGVSVVRRHGDSERLRRRGHVGGRRVMAVLAHPEVRVGAAVPLASLLRHRAGQLRNRIDAMAQTRPTELQQRRFRLTRKPAAVAEARGQVRWVIRAWKVPVDPDIAVLLTSDLVTSAIMHGNGETVMLVVRCPQGHLRIDVYDTSRSLSMGAGGSSGTENGPGLALVAALSTEWGSFRTPAGEAVYFTLPFLPDLPEVSDRGAAGDTRGHGEPI